MSMLWTNYYFYLMELSELERIKQISLLIGIWVIMILVGTIFEVVKKVNCKSKFYLEKVTSNYREKAI